MSFNVCNYADLEVTEGIYLNATFTFHGWVIFVSVNSSSLLQFTLFVNTPHDCTSVVLVWLYIIRFSCSKKANEEQSLVLVLVSQLKRKKGY